VENAAVRFENDGFSIYIQGTITKKEIERTLKERLPAAYIKHIFIRKQLPVDARHLSKIVYEKLK
jgi:hypothetical protein